uniref:DUF2256 domain-containing protein n=1 Tax=Cellvibrio fontiphilus TaxID=1815559 RepID=UPI002B4C1971|nr:DUF2256 domain-containing protein [Cellvibrio fontiphilus]
MKKQYLPQKTCVYCQRPFTWRKKWARDWEQVKYCSKACGAAARKHPPKTTGDLPLHA